METLAMADSTRMDVLVQFAVVLSNHLEKRSIYLHIPRESLTHGNTVNLALDLNSYILTAIQANDLILLRLIDDETWLILVVFLQTTSEDEAE